MWILCVLERQERQETGETGPSLYGISSSSDSWFWLTQSGQKRNFFERDRVCCNGPLGPPSSPPSLTHLDFSCGARGWEVLSVHPSVIRLFLICPSICHSDIPYLSLPCSISFCLHICHSAIPYLSLPCSISLCPSICHSAIPYLSLPCSISVCLHICHSTQPLFLSFVSWL